MEHILHIDGILTIVKNKLLLSKILTYYVYLLYKVL